MPPSHDWSKFVKGKSPDTFLYFAFGSNMSKARLTEQNPSAKFLTTALLKGYQLNFDAYSKTWEASPATITRTNDPADRVYGVLWELNLEDLSKLDKQEGVAYKVYHRLTVKVAPCKNSSCQNEDNYDGAVEAITYQLTQERIAKGVGGPEGLGDGRPNKDYKGYIVTGARENKLPKSYIDKLVAVKDNGKNRPQKGAEAKVPPKTSGKNPKSSEKSLKPKEPEGYQSTLVRKMKNLKPRLC